MGQERSTRVTFRTDADDSVSDGKALLETSELIFRGAFRLRIAFADIDRVGASHGRLTVTWPGGAASFELGADAAKWAEKIRNPRGLLDKLGVKPGMRVSDLIAGDEDFLAHLQERGVDLSAKLRTGSDVIFYAADEVADLSRLGDLRSSIKQDGSIWVVSPKGKGARIRDVDVIDAARQAALVDTKVVAFSTTQSALKLVIPVQLRTKGSPPQRRRARDGLAGGAV